MVANGPGFLPKTALVASRVAYYPFTVPQKMDDSATLVGKTLNDAVSGINTAVGSAYAALQPRGPAKWLLPLFDKINAATAHSTEIANRNKTVFWDPFSEGMEATGRAIASPGAYWYLKKAGNDAPTQDAIKAVLTAGLFKFPDGGGSAGPAPSSESTPGPSGGTETTPGSSGGAETAAKPEAQQIVPPATTPAGAEQVAEGAASVSPTA